MNRKTLFALLAAAACGAQATDCATGSAAERQLAVLELYTSEGCSSCPPADRWARALASRGDLVVVGFHVDYWDRLGWKDPWSDPRFGERQRVRAALTGARVVYTPDVVFDGRSRTDWARGWTPVPAASPPTRGISIHAALRAERRLEVSWRSPDAPPGSQAWIAVTESGLASRPTRGENAGQPLRHAPVVRAYAEHLDARGGTHALVLPTDVDLSAAQVVVVVEEARSARPVQVARASLGSCRPGA